MFRFALLASLIASPALADNLSPAEIAALPTALQTRITDATANCTEMEGGTLTVDSSGLMRPDLNRDGTPDWILDEQAFSCSSAQSLFCGTAGCNTTVLVGDNATEFYAKKTEVFQGEFFPVLIAWVHGNACDGYNYNPCALAMVWDQEEGKWNTVLSDNANHD